MPFVTPIVPAVRFVLGVVWGFVRVGRYCAAVVSQMTLGVSSGHGPGGTVTTVRVAEALTAGWLLLPRSSYSRQQLLSVLRWHRSRYQEVAFLSR